MQTFAPLVQGLTPTHLDLLERGAYNENGPSMMLSNRSPTWYTIYVLGVNSNRYDWLRSPIKSDGGSGVCQAVLVLSPTCTYLSSHVSLATVRRLSRRPLHDHEPPSYSVRNHYRRCNHYLDLVRTLLCTALASADPVTFQPDEMVSPSSSHEKATLTSARLRQIQCDDRFCKFSTTHPGNCLPPRCTETCWQ